MSITRVLAMRKHTTKHRKPMNLDLQTVRTLSSDRLTTVGGAAVCHGTINWSCCGECTNSGFISCIEF